MSKHTPGPWLRDGKTIYALMHAGWRKGVEQFKNRFYCSVYGDKDCDDDEWEATARLIASAPDLLEACRVAMKGLAIYADLHPESAYKVRWVVNYVNDAIAKAEGARDRAQPTDEQSRGGDAPPRT
jgi:hypothetical protein